jgi:uncharacterized protein (TIGR02588 family)
MEMSQTNAVQRESESSQSSQQGLEQTPLVETITGIIGLLLVLMTIGYLVYQGFQPQEPPEIVVAATKVITQKTGYLVEITVMNHGDKTAAGLVVTGELMPKNSENNQSVESSEVTFDFVPPHSQRQGGLFFSHSPLEYDLKLYAGGYIAP